MEIWSTSGGIGICVEMKYDKDLNDVPDPNRFYVYALRDLRKIGEYGTGKVLLNAIAAELKSGKQLTIAEETNAGNQIEKINRASRQVLIKPQHSPVTPMAASASSATSSGKTENQVEPNMIFSEGSCKPAADDKPVGRGKFSDCRSKLRIQYDPRICQYADGSPSWIVLAHELIHALHRFQGTRKPKDRTMWHDNKEVQLEELETVGLGPFMNDALTENALRKEAGLAARFQY